MIGEDPGLGHTDAESCPFWRAKVKSEFYGKLGGEEPYEREWPSPDSDFLKRFLEWAEKDRHGWPPDPLTKVRY